MTPPRERRPVPARGVRLDAGADPMRGDSGTRGGACGAPSAGHCGGLPRNGVAAENPHPGLGEDNAKPFPAAERLRVGRETGKNEASQGRSSAACRGSYNIPAYLPVARSRPGGDARCPSAGCPRLPAGRTVRTGGRALPIPRGAGAGVCLRVPMRVCV